MGTLFSKFLYFFLGAVFLATGLVATFFAGAFFATGAAGAGRDAEASKANRGVCEAVIEAMSR